MQYGCRRAAPTTYGCRLHYLRLQPPLHTVAGAQLHVELLEECEGCHERPRGSFYLRFSLNGALHSALHGAVHGAVHGGLHSAFNSMRTATRDSFHRCFPLNSEPLRVYTFVTAQLTAATLELTVHACLLYFTRGAAALRTVRSQRTRATGCPRGGGRGRGRLGRVHAVVTQSDTHWACSGISEYASCLEFPAPGLPLGCQSRRLAPAGTSCWVSHHHPAELKTRAPKPQPI